jgi:hypothetical protein
MAENATKLEQPAPITTMSAGEMGSAAGGVINKLAPAASTQNINAGFDYVGAMGMLFGDQGILQANPDLIDEYERTKAATDKAASPFGKQIAAATTSISKLSPKIKSLQAKVDAGTATKAEINTLARLNKQLTGFNTKLSTAKDGLASVKQGFTDWKTQNFEGKSTIQDMVNAKFPENKQTLDRATPYLDKMGQLGSAGERLMEALNKGYQANSIGSRDVTAALSGQGMVIGGPSRYTPDQVNAINAARVADVRAQQVGTGQLGSSLMGRAQTMANSTGQLNEQATRDAVQAARQGFASRGLATGNAALGAELLNRDRYARSRMFEDLGFARNIQIDDVDRQIRNAQNTLTGDMANQTTATNLSISDQRAAMDAQRFNQTSNQQADEYFQTEEGRRLANNQSDLTTRNTYDAGQINSVATGNANRELEGLRIDEEARRLGNQQNVGMLGDAFTTQNAVNTAGLGAELQRGGLASAANANNMVMGWFGAAQPVGTQSIGTAGNIVTTAATNDLNAQDINNSMSAWYNAANNTNYGGYGGQSGGQSGGSPWMGAASGAISGATAGAPLGPYGAGAGAVIGGVSGYLASK